MLRITGRVFVQETGEGLPAMHVKAVDKDLLFDDVLGTAITDRDGKYEITYDLKDFSELFEQGPDLYLVVRDASHQRVYSSEHHVHANASRDEILDAPIPQAALQPPRDPSDPYGPDLGRVKIRLSAATLPAQVLITFTEHRAEQRKQRRIMAAGQPEVAVELPTGEYTLQVSAPGFEPVRSLVEISGKRAIDVSATLTPRSHKPSTFAERLRRYEIDATKEQLLDLNVPANTTWSLNYQTDDAPRGFKMLQADSIAKVKRWVGSDDATFGHDRPVFGGGDRPLRAKLAAPKVDPQRLDPEDVRAVVAIGREYVEGNSRAVAHYEPLLNAALKLSAKDGLSKIPLYFYKIVTIGAGATLVVGNGSAVFTCDELRIHKTGRLRPVANVKIEIGTYREFT